MNGKRLIAINPQKVKHCSRHQTPLGRCNGACLRYSPRERRWWWVCPWPGGLTTSEKIVLFSTTIAIVYLSRHTAVDVTVTAESVTEESFTDYLKETFEFESLPFTGAAICGHPGLSFPGWVATGTAGRGCHTGWVLPLYDQQNMNSNMVTFGIIS